MSCILDISNSVSSENLSQGIRSIEVFCHLHFLGSNQVNVKQGERCRIRVRKGYFPSCLYYFKNQLTKNKSRLKASPAIVDEDWNVPHFRYSFRLSHE